MNRWLLRLSVVAAFLGSVFVAPVVAQVVVRIYGTTSGGTFLPALVDSTGRLIVSLSGGSVSPDRVLVGDGTVAAPSYSFTNDTDTGLWRPGSGELAFSSNNANQWDTFSSNFRLSSGLNVCWASGDPTSTGCDTSLSRGAANRLDLATGDSFNMVSGSYLQNNVLTLSTTAPTISSGFGTTPSIAASNGTAAFTINVGTGGVATTGVIGLPAATTGWALQCMNTSTNTATVFLTKQTATTTTTATIGNYDAAGAAAAWVASNILVCSAIAF